MRPCNVGKGTEQAGTWENIFAGRGSASNSSTGAFFKWGFYVGLLRDPSKGPSHPSIIVIIQ
eukprot:scaffold11300_cov32-Tisochrysis_lutea.AAC.1